MLNKLFNFVNVIFDNITVFLFGVTFGDKVKHTTLLFLINVVIFLILFNFLDTELSLVLSNIITMAIGFYKEKVDKSTTGFSKKDIFFDFLGVFLSDIIIILFI